MGDSLNSGLGDVETVGECLRKVAILSINASRAVNRRHHVSTRFTLHVRQNHTVSTGLQVNELVVPIRVGLDGVGLTSVVSNRGPVVAYLFLELNRHTRERGLVLILHVAGISVFEHVPRDRGRHGRGVVRPGDHGTSRSSGVTHPRHVHVILKIVLRLDRERQLSTSGLQVREVLTRRNRHGPLTTQTSEVNSTVGIDRASDGVHLRTRRQHVVESNLSVRSERTELHRIQGVASIELGAANTVESTRGIPSGRRINCDVSTVNRVNQTHIGHVTVGGQEDILRPRLTRGELANRDRGLPGNGVLNLNLLVDGLQSGVHRVRSTDRLRDRRPGCGRGCGKRTKSTPSNVEGLGHRSVDEVLTVVRVDDRVHAERVIACAPRISTVVLNITRLGERHGLTGDRLNFPTSCVNQLKGGRVIHIVQRNGGSHGVRTRHRRSHHVIRGLELSSVSSTVKSCGLVHVDERRHRRNLRETQRNVPNPRSLTAVADSKITTRLKELRIVSKRIVAVQSLDGEVHRHRRRGISEGVVRHIGERHTRSLRVGHHRVGLNPLITNKPFNLVLRRRENLGAKLNNDLLRRVIGVLLVLITVSRVQSVRDGYIREVLTLADVLQNHVGFILDVVIGRDLVALSGRTIEVTAGVVSPLSRVRPVKVTLFVDRLIMLRRSVTVVPIDASLGNFLVVPGSAGVVVVRVVLTLRSAVPVRSRIVGCVLTIARISHILQTTVNREGIGRDLQPDLVGPSGVALLRKASDSVIQVLGTRVGHALQLTVNHRNVRAINRPGRAIGEFRHVDVGNPVGFRRHTSR